MTTNTIETTPAKPVSSMPWFCVSWSVAEVGLVWLAVATESVGAGNLSKHPRKPSGMLKEGLPIINEMAGVPLDMLKVL